MHLTPFESLLEGAPDGMVITDRNGIIAKVNRQAEKLFGYDRNELIGQNVDLLVPERFRRKHPDFRNGYVLAPRPRPMGIMGSELYGLRKDGSEFPAEISLSPIEMKGETYVIAAVRDGTVRHNEQEKFRKLLEAAPDAMVISDATGSITLVNKQAELLFGYAKAELLGKPVETLIPERFRQHHPAHRTHYFSEPRPRPMGFGGLSLFGLRKNGEEFPAEISLSPLETEGGLLAITAIRDISERRRAEMEQKRLAKADEDIRVRDEFLSIASHELKTPLTVLQMQAESILRVMKGPIQDLNPVRLVKKMGTILQAIQKLSTLVNQLLDLSKITAGRITPQLEEVDLVQLVSGTAEQFQDELQRAGCELSLDVPERIVGQWDPLRLEQILVNLLSNAIKYGGGRPIKVSLQRFGNMAQLSVADHGIGIPPENQARIFERFERLVSERNYGGFGLGLWIVRQLAEAQGGQIRVVSELGVGSTFTIDLPIDQSLPPGAPARLAKDYILVVEDDPLIRQSFEDILSDEGYDVALAVNGMDALQLLRSGIRPRVIILDLMMPVMDGFGFRAEQLKDPELAAIPVIVVSAMGDLEKNAASLQVGGILTKPLQIDLLLEAIAPFLVPRSKIS